MLTRVFRAPADAPDNSPDADALHGFSQETTDDEAGMVFHLEDATALAAPQRPMSLRQASATGPRATVSAARPAAAVVPAAPLTAPQVVPPLAAAAVAPPPPPAPPRSGITDVALSAAKEQAAVALQAALAGLPPIRKAVMRGRADSGTRRGPAAKADPAAGGAVAWEVKAQAPLERGWVPPGWTSPARASQAA